jgi:hypothetical protein
MFAAWALLGLAVSITLDLSTGATPKVVVPLVYGTGALVLWLGYRSLKLE